MITLAALTETDVRGVIIALIVAALAGGGTYLFLAFLAKVAWAGVAAALVFLSSRVDRAPHPMTRLTCDRAFRSEDWHGQLVEVRGSEKPRLVALIVLRGPLMDLYVV